MKMELSESSFLTWDPETNHLKAQLDPDGVFEVNVNDRCLFVEKEGFCVAYASTLLHIDEDGVRIQNGDAKAQLTPEFLRMTYNIYNIQLNNEEVSIHCDKSKINLSQNEIKLQVGPMTLTLSPLGLTLNGREVLVA